MEFFRMKTTNQRLFFAMINPEEMYSKIICQNIAKKFSEKL